MCRLTLEAGNWDSVVIVITMCSTNVLLAFVRVKTDCVKVTINYKFYPHQEIVHLAELDT